MIISYICMIHKFFFVSRHECSFLYVECCSGLSGWNRLFFLWGVFVGRRVSCSETLPQSQEKPLEASLNLEQSSQDLPILVPETSASQKLNNESKEILIHDNLSELKDVESVVGEKFHSISPTGTDLRYLSCYVSSLVCCLSEKDELTFQLTFPFSWIRSAGGSFLLWSGK